RCASAPRGCKPPRRRPPGSPGRASSSPGRNESPRSVRPQRDVSDLVILRHAEPIEDAQGIQEHLDDGPKVDAAPEPAPEVHLERHLANPVAKRVREDEELCVEGVTFHEAQRQNALQDLPLESLDSGLRIAQSQSEQGPDDEFVRLAEDPALKRVVDFRLRVALRADHDADVVLAEDANHRDEMLRVNVQVAVEETHDAPPRVGEHFPQCATFPTVLGHSQDVDSRHARGNSFRNPGRAVHGAVVDQQDLEPAFALLLQDGDGLYEAPSDIVGLIVARETNAHIDARRGADEDRPFGIYELRNKRRYPPPSIPTFTEGALGPLAEG